MTRRLDQALVGAGLVGSRARAQALIAAGAVTVDGRVAAKPAQKVAAGSELKITADPVPYVSRGALKLKHALEVFGLDPSGAVALDLGASTGGFSQVLLEAGAAEVWAVDVGHGQMHHTFLGHPALHVIEGKNVRDLVRADVPVPDWIVADLSFISLIKALPAALDLARPGATLVALIKPQFEVGREFVGKGGLVRDQNAIARAVADVRAFLQGKDWELLGETVSPITGGDGNTEYLIGARKAPE